MLLEMVTPPGSRGHQQRVVRGLLGRQPLREPPSHWRDCHSDAPPLPLVGVSIGMERARQQNDSLADG